ncbi:MAG: hypothetical protein ACHREM_31925, partial [Polyangiales bacterium]
FLGRSDHGRVGLAVEVAIDRLADGYSKLLRRALPWRVTILIASLALVVTDIGAPSLARSAMNSPSAGPHMGFRVASSSRVERPSNLARFGSRWSARRRSARVRDTAPTPSPARS